MDSACKALYNGDCEQAAVVSINLQLSMDICVRLCAAGMLSRKGRRAAFSDEADGCFRGEGGGAVVLQPLSSALTADQGMWGTVHGTAVNQDGRTATPTAPNGPSQETAVQSAVHRAGLRPTEIGYVEAHGTGTPRGDPQEAAALGHVSAGAGRQTPLLAGAAKSNMGHLEWASGMVGLMKAVLCVLKNPNC